MLYYVRNEENRIKHYARRMFAIAYSASLMLVTPLAEAQGSADLIQREGIRAEARLASCTPQGAWIFEIKQQPTTMQAGDFIRWGHPANKLDGPVLFLTDGSCLVADEAFAQLQIKEDKVQFDSKSIGDGTRIPLQWVEGIMLKPDANAQQRDLWLEQIRNQPRERDLVLLENEDQLEGIIIELSESELQLQRNSGDTLRIPRQNVKAIAFQPALLERLKPIEQLLILQLADGSSIRAASWKGDTGIIRVRTAGDNNALGFNIPLKNTRNKSQIVGLLPIGFDSMFLSEIKETQYKHQPFLSLDWPYRRDRNVLGERLQTRSKIYEKGIGMHPDAELSFQLKEPFKRLDGEAGIDDSAEGQGSVIFEILVQRGESNWQTAFKSQMIRGGDPTEPFSIDLKGVRAIRLKVEHAADGDTRDRANWLDARLSR
jgi:hypothetical protein